MKRPLQKGMAAIATPPQRARVLSCIKKLTDMHWLRMFMLLWLCAWASQAQAQSTFTYGNEWIDFSKRYFKFPVNDNRFFRITQATLQSAGLGGVPAEHFQLWRDGKEVPIFTSVPSGPLPTGGFIELIGMRNTGFSEADFYNNPLHHTHPERSHFNDTAWYYLTVETTRPNLRYTQTPNLVSTTTLPVDSFYMHQLNGLASTSSRNFGFARVIGSDFIRSSNWDVGESFSSGQLNGTNRTAEFNLTTLRAFPGGPDMQLTYAAAGATLQSRTVRMLLNDVQRDSVFVSLFNLMYRNVSSISMQNVVNDAINFKFRSSNTSSGENVTINRFILTYPRRFFNNTQLHLEVTIPANPNGNHLRIASLPNGSTAPVLYDVTHLKRYTGVFRTDTSLFLLEPSDVERTLVFGTQVTNHLRNVATLTPVNFINYKLAQNQFDYLMITHRQFLADPGGVVHDYAAYRGSLQGGGFRVGTHDIDDLADQFCYGNRKNPLAIRRFIIHAVDHYAQKPKFVLLLGRGSTYHQFRVLSMAQKEMLNAVPTYGLPASDNMLATRNNMLPVPEVPIGRISAVSIQEIRNYLNKLIEFETLQRMQPFLPSNNDWRKRITHLIGGDDQYLADSILSRFMQNYTRIISAPMVGADVRQFSRPNNPNYVSDMKEIEQRISSGSGLVTYFGHSSTSSIDFNLGSPDQFANTDGKYPIFIANGCRAGNIFDAFSARINASAIEASISENFTLTPRSGSIAFFSNSDLGAINYQNLLSTEWYRAASGSHFGKSIGEIQQVALKAAYDRTGPEDFINRCNIEQNVLNGDPAIKLFYATLPDFAIETTSLQTQPGSIYTETDSVHLQVRFSNLGTVLEDSVYIRVEREMPDGNNALLLHTRVKAPFFKDSLQLSFGIKGLFEEGNNFLIARIDPNNDWQEQDEDNNVAVFPMTIARKYIQPVYPYNYAIVNTLTPQLIAQTSDPLEMEKTYTFQLDTTALFNSPMLQETQITSIGGSISWQPATTLQDGKVYYWRAFVANTHGADMATRYSFTTAQGTAVGFNQAHYFQYLANTGKINVDSSRNLSFSDKLNNIFVAHGIWQTSATEEGHLSITHNGAMKMRSACIGRSIIFHVFDPLTFEPWLNVPGGLYNSAAFCGAGREYNFEFRYNTPETRKHIMDFMEAIPNGMFVASRLNLDPPYDAASINVWLNDTLLYGSGNSVYHSFKKYGFEDIDLLTIPRTFFFMYKKNDTLAFKPYYKLSKGLSDRLHASLFPETPDTSGNFISEWMGPAVQWQKAQWQLSQQVNDAKAPGFTMHIWGRTPQGNRTLLQTVPGAWTYDEDISHIDATAYPYLQYELVSNNDFQNHPAQIDYWRMYYSQLPDGAWSGRDHFVSNLDTLKPQKDTMHLEIAFKNISADVLAATEARAYLVGDDNSMNLFATAPLKQLGSGDTAIFSIHREVLLPPGNYELRIIANEDVNPQELHYYNNLAVLKFLVKDEALPVQMVDFMVQREGKSALLSWQTRGIEDVQAFEPEHSTNGRDFSTLATLPVPAVQGQAEGTQASYTYLHQRPEAGSNHYRIKIIRKNGSILYSGIRTLGIDGSNALKILPNPFYQYFTVQPADNNKKWQLNIRDLNGKLIKVVQATGSHRVDIGNAPSGMYIAEWTSGEDRAVLKLMKH